MPKYRFYNSIHWGANYDEASGGHIIEAESVQAAYEAANVYDKEKLGFSFLQWQDEAGVWHWVRRIEEAREYVAKLADAEGEVVFAAQVRAGSWDHRSDVKSALLRDFKPRASDRQNAGGFYGVGSYSGEPAEDVEDALAAIDLAREP